MGIIGKLNESGRADFLRELSGLRDNLKRCELVRSRIDSIVANYEHEGLVEVKTENLNSAIVPKGLYNIMVSVPDVRRAGSGDKSLDELVFSCHSDAIRMSLKDSVGPGVNDNGSGAAVLLDDLEDNLRHLSEVIGERGADSINDVPRTTYMFFTGEEGSLGGVGLSGLSAGLAYAVPGAIFGQIFLPGLGLIVPAAYSLILMESMSRSPMFTPGLCGSYSWAMSMDEKEISKPKALVNFDMVGCYAPSVNGGLKGLVEEISKTGLSLIKKNQENGDCSREKDTLKTVIVPESNIGTNPSSWVSPVRHDVISPLLSDIVYAESVKSGKLYNVRNNLSLGSSDHASVQQVSDRRGGNIEAAMMIGLGGMKPEREIHTDKDNQVDNDDMEFSCKVASSVARHFGRKWKDYSYVSHLKDLSYAGLFYDGKEGLALARCLDSERDQWVNLLFGYDGEIISDGIVGNDRLIVLDPDKLVEWNLGNDLVEKGFLKGSDGFAMIPTEGLSIGFHGNDYVLEKQDARKSRQAETIADVSRFLAERQIIPLIGAAIPVTSAITGAGLAVAAAVPAAPVQAGLLLGSAVAAFLAGYGIIKIPLQYSNVIAETLYDIEAGRANSQLYRAVPAK